MQTQSLYLTKKVEKSKVIRPRAAAYTHYDHLDNNSELKQTVDDPYEECVEFAPIHIWYTGEENLVEYILPDDFEEASSDWIGIFKVMSISLHPLLMW